MYVLACILDGFYAAVSSKGGAGPLVVQRDKKVLDACEAARDRGVVVGMPLAEANSLVADDGQIVEWTEEPYRSNVVWRRPWARVNLL